MSKALSYRASVDSDLPLIREGFLDSYRTSHAAGLIAMEDWHDVMALQWAKVLARPGTEIFVAYHPGEKDTGSDLYGFIVVERDYIGKDRLNNVGPMPFVVYIYTKHNYRNKGFGIARGLFQAASIDPAVEFHHACKTGVLGKFASKIPLAKWKPLPMRFAPKR